MKMNKILNQVAERDLWNEKFVGKPVKELVVYMKDYKRRLTGLKPALKNVLKEISLKSRSLETTAKQLAILGRQSHHTGGPMLPRVVIIGTRGSFKRTIACEMEGKYGVVHVDMDELINKALQRDDKLGQELRDLASRNVRLYGKLIVSILEDRLLDYDCLNKGWVLTGFPRDHKDFAVLDMFDTPPNRVIFITNNSLEALERITNRRINIFTGDYKHKDEIAAMEDTVLANQFVIHPDDELTTVIKQQKEFEDSIQGMLDYCQGNCIIVDGTGSYDAVMQRIIKSTFQAAPPSGLREPKIDDRIPQKKQMAFEKSLVDEETKPAKSTLLTPGKSKTTVRFEVSEQIQNQTSEEAKKSESNVDSTKPICVNTSISSLTKNTPSSVIKTVKELKSRDSCTSIFPREIQKEWGKMRNNAKSYTSIFTKDSNK